MNVTVRELPANNFISHFSYSLFLVEQFCSMDTNVSLLCPVADPGFSRGGGANSQSRCANLLYYIAENYMKMKEFGSRRGRRVPGTPWVHQRCLLCVF